MSSINDEMTRDEDESFGNHMDIVKTTAITEILRARYMGQFILYLFVLGSLLEFANLLFLIHFANDIAEFVRLAMVPNQPSTLITSFSSFIFRVASTLGYFHLSALYWSDSPAVNNLTDQSNPPHAQNQGDRARL